MQVKLIKQEKIISCILHGYRYRIGRCVFACCIRRYSVTVDELRNMFSNEIVDGVITLTHRKDESYFEYISRVSTSKLAKKVKTADLYITRIKEPTKTDYERLEKYKKVILYRVMH